MGESSTKKSTEMIKDEFGKYCDSVVIEEFSAAIKIGYNLFIKKGKRSKFDKIYIKSPIFLKKKKVDPKKSLHKIGNIE